MDRVPQRDLPAPGRGPATRPSRADAARALRRAVPPGRQIDKVRRGGLLFAVGLVGLLAARLARPAPDAPASGSSVPRLAPPEATPTAAPFPERFALGINEAVSVPQKRLREGHFAGDALAEHLALDAERAAGLGARYVRGHSGAFPRSSWWASQQEPGVAEEIDLWVRTVQERGLEPILMVSPWPGNRTANYAEAYVPADMAGYTSWVTALAERYDGDGVADMPGLRRPLRYWEIDNEPDLKLSDPPRDATRDVPPGSFCRPEEYAAVLVATSAAIRSAHPAARILNGGLFRPYARSGQAYLRDLLAVPGAREAFDILSVHSYASDEHGDAFAKGLGAVRALAPDKPLFVTEASVASEGDERWMTPEWQARMVATLAARAAASGAHALLWHTLADPPVAGRRSGFERHSLLTGHPDGSATEKPAAVVFRNLAARLAEDDLNGAKADGNGAVVLRSGARLVYSPPADHTNAWNGINLMDGKSVSNYNTVKAPVWLWP